MASGNLRVADDAGEELLGARVLEEGHGAQGGGLDARVGIPHQGHERVEGAGISQERQILDGDDADLLGIGLGGPEQAAQQCRVRPRGTAGGGLGCTLGQSGSGREQDNGKAQAEHGASQAKR